MMKRITLYILLLVSTFALGQVDEQTNLIDLDSTWGQEIFPFPISFAQDINYEGIADVRFPPEGWNTENHPFFWSYTYAWSIDINHKITEEELAKNLEKYFDGLNGFDAAKENQEHKASAIINRVERKNEITFFNGSIKTFDRFTTNKAITLNVLIEDHFCEKQQKTILLFKFSPKDFTHSVWETLNTIKLVEDDCKN